MVTKTEKYAEGKYFVYIDGQYPQRIGHITGSKGSWLAESGPNNLGYHKTLTDAIGAIKFSVTAEWMLEAD